MYYNYDYEPIAESTSSTGIATIWLVVALVIAVIGGLVAYFLFIKPDKEVNNKYLKWLKDFCNFKKMLIEDLLKIAYVMLTIFITLFALLAITENILACILILVIGNLLVRLVFEACLINIMIWKNTTEINQKIKK